MGINNHFGNYNSFNFSETGYLRADNDNAISDVRKNGRCNNCIYFSFGGFKCSKRNEDGSLKRPNLSPMTYSEPTDKGGFIHVLKPVDCNDYEGKNKPKEGTGDNNAV